MNAPALTRHRVSSIDFVRGLVMVIMALDHVRDFFYTAPVASTAGLNLDPTNPATTTPLLFFTRWITHLCAPTFVLLTGVAAYLNGRKKTKRELSIFLFQRGLFLIFVEIIVISLAWTFDPLYHLVILQVIWAIGVSMILLALLIHLPKTLILLTGIILVAAHNILDFIPGDYPVKSGLIPNMLYSAQFHVETYAPDRFIIFVYAFLPWTGVMAIGYCLGRFFESSVDAAKRKRILVSLGLGIIAFFILLRWTNAYGDPSNWAVQARGGFYSFLSFLNTTKYPASLLFLSMAIGPALLMLAAAEHWRNGLARIFINFGKVPLFYYIAHLYLYHVILVIVFYLQGFTSKDIVNPAVPFFFHPDGIGFGLSGVYAIWLAGLIILYPLCLWYNRYKSTHSYWWLKYV
jgi:uncharacterized membrane protein